MTIIEGPILFDAGIVVDNACLGKIFECVIANRRVQIELPSATIDWYEHDGWVSSHQEMVSPNWKSIPESLYEINKDHIPGLREIEVPGVLDINKSFGEGPSVWGSSISVRTMKAYESIEGSTVVRVGRMSYTGSS